MLDHLQSALSKFQQTCASNTLPSIRLGGDFNLTNIDWTNNSLRTYPQYGEVLSILSLIKGFFINLNTVV